MVLGNIAAYSYNKHDHLIIVTELVQFQVVNQSSIVITRNYLNIHHNVRKFPHHSNNCERFKIIGHDQ